MLGSIVAPVTDQEARVSLSGSQPLWSPRATQGSVPLPGTAHSSLAQATVQVLEMLNLEVEAGKQTPRGPQQCQADTKLLVRPSSHHLGQVQPVLSSQALRVFLRTTVPWPTLCGYSFSRHTHNGPSSV